MRIIAVCILILFMFGCIDGNQEKSVVKPIGNISNNQSNNTNSTNHTSTIEPVKNTTVPATFPQTTVPKTNSTTTDKNNSNPQTMNETTGVVNATKTNDGLWFGNMSYFLVLNDVATYSTEDNCGMFTVNDAKNNELAKMIICEGNERAWASPEGKIYRIKVYTTAAGYSKQNTWASVIIYS